MTSDAFRYEALTREEKDLFRQAFVAAYVYEHGAVLLPPTTEALDVAQARAMQAAQDCLRAWRKVP